MFPLNAIPVSGNTKFQVFYANGTAWQTWQKPAGCSMVYIFMLGAGGGGGRPPNGASTVGGGGGGSGAVARGLIPAILLPDTLYVQPGVGGLGATTANTAGGNAGDTIVAVQPSTNTEDRVISIGGGNLGGAASTTGGSGALARTAANSGAYSSLGLWYSIAGQAGLNGASTLNGAGGSVTAFTSGIITSSGAGGSNGTVNGAQITGSGLIPTISGGIGVGANGRPGFQRGAIIQQGLKSFPLIFSGGSGGAGGTTATAGNGGDASYGGGGGGGGGCSGAGTSGNGGNGGDGFVIIGTF